MYDSQHNRQWYKIAGTTRVMRTIAEVKAAWFDLRLRLCDDWRRTMPVDESWHVHHSTSFSADCTNGRCMHNFETDDN